MSQVDCPECRGSFDAEVMPTCPTCLVAMWIAAPTFVRPKHDPRLLPIAWESYRSVLTPNVVVEPAPHLDFAARSGTWYRDNYYEMYVHMTVEPLGRAPGSGIPEGKTTPEHSLDSLLIAEANSPVEAHGFAVSQTQFNEQVRAGEFEPLPVCRETDCKNIAVPGSSSCVAHANKNMDESA